MNAPAPTETPEAKLFRLTAEHQDLAPDHTHRAFMHRVNSKESVEDRCELLEEGLEEFRRGLLENRRQKKGR
jgi:hypothetical protein